MSRILRRPMFRGGRVDGRGTGIASGLGYNNGGRVGYGNGGVSTTGGFKRSPIAKGLGWLSDHLLTPWANQFNRTAVNPFTSLFGYGDWPPTGATPFNTPKEEWEVMSGEKQAPIVTDSGAIPKAIKEQDDAIFLEKLEAEKLAKEDKSLEEIMKEMMGSKKTKKETIEEYKETFKDAYGSGRADDASAMALSFAKNALAPDATVKTAFAGFFDDESKRPSESKKYKDAATTAAINAFLTGEKDYDSMMKQMKMIDYQIGAKSDAAKAAKEDLSFIEIKSGLPTSVSKDRERTKAAAELFVQYTDKGKTFTVIDEDEDTDALLKAPENEGQYFMNNETKQVFKIVKGIKQFIYGG